MIVICENCGARYKFNDYILGLDGHHLRCKKCEHTWFQKPENEAFSVEIKSGIDYIKQEKIAEWLNENDIKALTQKEFHDIMKEERKDYNITYPAGWDGERHGKNSTSHGDDPTMEDILGSIRRILSEEEYEDIYIFFNEDDAVLFKLTWC